MYTLTAYGSMLGDDARTNAHVAALTRAVKPGDVVVDLGAGTGFFALVACQLGARHVYAIEIDDAIQVARACAVANGYTDRITFLQEDARRITLPEPAQVIIADLRGALPLFQHHLPVLADVRRRWLAPGGVLIPYQDELYVSVVSAPKQHDQLFRPWLANGRDLDLRAVLPYVTNTWLRTDFDVEQLLTTPMLWQCLPYHDLKRWDVEAEVELTVERPATARGLGIWFEAELFPGIRFSNAPGRAETVYGQSFFPWPEAIAVQAGDVASVRLRAQLIGQDYVWRWQTTLRRGQVTLATWDQSTFFADPRGLERLRRMTRAARPGLREDARILAFILNHLDGQATLDEIARNLHAAFPGAHATVDAAWERVVWFRLNMGADADSSGQVTSTSPEVALLVYCLKPTAGQPPASLIEQCQWNRLQFLAEEHGVRPWLCRSLLRNEKTHWRQELHQLQRELASRSLFLAAELRRITYQLNQHGVRCLAYKGPTLALLAHGDLVLRESGDLDLFVAPGQVEPAAQALGAIQYQIDLAGNRQRARRYVATTGQLPLRHAQTDLLVEIHAALLPPAFGFALPFAQAWKRRRTVELAGYAAATLGQEDLLALLVAHGSKHLWACLGWIHDLAAYCRCCPNVDWDLVLRHCRHWQGVRSLHLATMLMDGLLEYPTPLPLPEDNGLRNLARGMIDRLLSGTTAPPSGLASAWFQFQARDGWRTGLRWAFDLAITPTTADWQDHADPAWTLYARRPLRLASKWLWRR